jgi:hypothetical protein
MSYSTFDDLPFHKRPDLSPYLLGKFRGHKKFRGHNI